MRLPNLNALRAFEAAARHGSFTLAADELGVTQAAVSRHVRNLEKQLSVLLFKRGHRSVVLTLEGQHYAERVAEGLATIASFNHSRSKITRQRIAIEIDADLMLMWLLPRLKEGTLKSLPVELQFRSRLDLPRSLPGDTDLAILWGANEYPGFRCNLFLEPQAFPVSAPFLAGGRPAPSQSTQFQNYRLIHERDDYWWRQFLGEALLASARNENHITLNRTYLVAEAAAAGLGLAVGDDVVFANFLKSGRLVQLNATRLKASRSFFIYEPARHRVSASVAPVKNWLMEEARNHAQWQMTFRDSGSTGHQRF